MIRATTHKAIRTPHRAGQKEPDSVLTPAARVWNRMPIDRKQHGKRKVACRIRWRIKACDTANRFAKRCARASATRSPNIAIGRRATTQIKRKRFSREINGQDRAEGPQAKANQENASQCAFPASRVACAQMPRGSINCPFLQLNGIESTSRSPLTASIASRGRLTTKDQPPF